MDSKRGRIESLEGLRGVAALLVVFYHLPIWHPALNIGPLQNGHLMVDVFFVLSGFVICTAFGGTLHSASDVLRFQLLRLLRLYPVHAVLLLAFVMVEVIKWLAQTYAGISSPNTEPFGKNSPQALLQHLLLVQAIGPGSHPLTFNTPAWSISVEFWTYLAFALLTLLSGPWRRAAFAAMAGGSVLLLLLGLGAGGWNDLLRCFAGFFVGAWLVGLTQRPPVAVGAAAVGGLVLMLVLADASMASRVMTMALSAVTVLSLIQRHWLSSAFECAPLRVLGALSFSLYMGHTLVIWIANQIGRFVLRGPELVVHGVSTPQLSLPVAVLGWLLVVAASLGLAALLRQHVELPCQRLSRKLAARPMPVWRARAS